MTGSLSSLAALKAHAGDQHRPNPAMVTMATGRALALIEVVEAAQDVYGKNPFRERMEHSEENEITCCCGFTGKSDDYYEAERQLDRHLKYHWAKALKAADERQRRLSDALAVFVSDPPTGDSE